MADTESIKNAFDIGREAHQKGDLRAAKDAFASALTAQPDNADVLHALSIVETEQGQLNEAEAHVRKAIKLNRYGVGFQNSLGNLLFAQKRFREAESAFFEELRMRPDYAAAHNQLGNLMMRTGNVVRAIKHYQSALQFAPSFAAAANNLGRAYMLDKQYAQATEAFNSAILIAPKFAEAHANIGVLKFHMGQSVEAADHFERALTLNPNCAPAIRGIGLLRITQGKVQEAIAAFTKAIEISHDDVESIHALAKIWHRQGIWDEAEKHYLRARDLAPNNIDILNQLAQLQLARGKTDVATECYEMALQIRPSDQVSLAGYGRLKADSGDTKLALSKLSSVVQSGRAGTALLGAYAKLLGTAGRGREGITLLEQRLRTKVAKEEKCQLHFTLGDLLDSDSSYDLAFYHYRKANELKKAKFDQSAFTKYCGRIINAFSRDNLDLAARSKNDAEKLVFLIGMPRSGVRVLEQFLDTQAKISISGESPFVEMSAYRICSEHQLTWPDKIEQISQQTLDSFSQLYLNRVMTGKDEQTRIVDATWRNFLYVGIIQLLFPKARIVYCSRDYRDIALSCFFNDFGSQAGLSFAYNLQDIATVVNQHKRVMAHWNNTISLPLHVVSYEKMILDFDDEIAKLRRFLGVRISFKSAANGAGSGLPKPSFLRSTSLRRYRHYRNHLEAFLEKLESPPDQAF